jgi:hypothetical protein
MDKRPGLKRDLEALDDIEREIVHALIDAQLALRDGSPLTIVKANLEIISNRGMRLAHLARHVSKGLAEHINRHARVA